MNSDHLHTPVLLEPVLELLRPQAGESYLDLTAGYGGHARAILAQTNAPTTTVLVDRDEQAITALQADPKLQNCTILQADFLTAAEQLQNQGLHFDLILMDLGVSSPQLDQADRGFSFNKDAALDMRMDRRQSVNAADIVNNTPEDDLAQIIRDYGEEPRAKRVAQAIVAARPLTSTSQLAEVVASCLPKRGRIHPATKTFQALRIAVNDELGLLEDTLRQISDLLAPGGRIAIISFHSLEDRLVKRFLREHDARQYTGDLQLLTKKPLTAAGPEDVQNPRARSAKLRGAVKIKIQKQKKGAVDADTDQI